MSSLSSSSRSTILKLPISSSYSSKRPIHHRYISTLPQATPLLNRRVLQISGKDSAKFLKGLTCRDVESLGGGGGYSGFLSASGRVLYDIFIYPTTSTAPSTSTSPTTTTTAYLIDYPSPISGPPPSSSDLSSDPAPSPQDLVKYIKKFILRSKVKIKDVSEEYQVWQAWGGDEPSSSSSSSSSSPEAIEREWIFGNGGSAEPHWEFPSIYQTPDKGLKLKEGEVGCWDLRAGWGQEGMGKRIILRKGVQPSILSHHDTTSYSNYLFRRMILGIPEGPEELIPEVALPLESCMDVHSGVDFRKGCYVGQELTVRTYHTGHTRKRIMPIRFLPFATSSSSASYESLLPPNEPSTWSSLLPSSPSSSTNLIPFPGTPISYLPPSTSSTQKPKSAVKVLSVHPEYAIGLGLIRMEYVERVWGGVAEFGTVFQRGKDGYGQGGKLVVGKGGAAEEVGRNVWAGKGRGWYTKEKVEEAQKSGEDVD